MRTEIPLPDRQADVSVAVASVASLGLGAVLALGGVAAGAPEMALTGGVLAAAALTLLISAGWLSPLAIVAVSLPLPALYSDSPLRLTPAAALTAIALFAWAMGRFLGPRPLDVAGLPRRSTAALFCAVLVAALFANAPTAAARELLNLAVLLGLLVMATDLLAGDRRRVHALMITLAAVAGFAGFLAAIEALGVGPTQFPLAGTSLYRAALGFGQPNGLGVYLAVSLPLCWYCVRIARGLVWRALAMAGLGAAGLGLVATFSRGSWLAFLVSAGVLLLTGGGRLLFRIVAGVLIAAAFVDLAAGGLITTRFWNLTTDPYVIQRAALMLVALIMFRENPLVGVGPGGFLEHLEEYGPQIPWLWDYIGSAHNAYLEMAAETGIIGLVAFLWFLGAVFLVLLHAARTPAADSAEWALRRALLWSFAAACLAGFTGWPFAHGIGQLIMLVIAMGMALAGPTATEGSMRDEEVEAAP